LPAYSNFHSDSVMEHSRNNSNPFFTIVTAEIFFPGLI